MIIYTGALIWVLILYLHNTRGYISLSEKQEATRVQAFFAMLYLVFFIGLRSAGADTSAYLRAYTFVQPGFRHALSTMFNFRERENFFETYGVIMKTIFGSNYTPYLFGIAAFSGFAIAKCLYRYSEGYFTSMIFFVLWGNWSWMFNGIRQFLAVSIIFLGLSMIVDGHPIKYILIVLIASRIHTSALMMIPVFFLVRSEPWQLRTIITILFAVIIVFFISPFLEAMEIITEGMDYNTILTNTYFQNDSGSNPIRTIIYAIPAVLAFIERDKIEREAPDVIKICVNMSILCVCVSAIANVTSGIYIGRLPIYFSVYSMILMPWLFCNTDIGKRSGWIPAIMTFYIVYYVYMYYYNSHYYYISDILNLRLS